MSAAPAVTNPAALSREAPAGRRPGWWGMVLFLTTDVAAFASLLAAYFYLRFVASEQWPPPGDPLPKLALSSIMTGLLVVSVAPMVVADLGLKRGSRGRLLGGGVLTVLLGAAFVVLECLEYVDELQSTWPTKNAYGSLFYTITGFHLLHIILGVLALAMFLVAGAIGRLTREHHVWMRVFALYWHTSVVVWVLVYASLYGAVRL
jgi:heme/copper-type cytochrome/quinol oxidase subunit 3